MLLLTKYTVLYKENEICCIILLSLPSRERGLKSQQGEYFKHTNSSLPSRERGLKLPYIGKGQCCHRSLPSRERGLKYMYLNPWLSDSSVAPFAGAWIEIYETSKRMVYL